MFSILIVTATFSCTLKFLVKDCDPNTGEPDDEGYDDEYVVSLRPQTATLHVHVMGVVASAF